MFRLDRLVEVRARDGEDDRLTILDDGGHLLLELRLRGGRGNRGGRYGVCGRDGDRDTGDWLCHIESIARCQVKPRVSMRADEAEMGGHPPTARTDTTGSLWSGEQGISGGNA
jgi:hypothetical protein